ncbi:MAG: superoxide dismutase family protein [Balneolaceae bacterium]
MIRTLIAMTALLIGACTQQPAEPQPTMDHESMTPEHDQLVAVLHPTAGNETSGVVTFTREGDQVRVSATIEGLDPESRHGFHIHQFGDCTASDGTSAGGHFNPAQNPHAGPDSEQRHVGDLGNLESNADGVAELNHSDAVIELGGTDSILGRGVIVHAGEDDMESQPTGDAGSRLACGVIGVSQQ